MRQKEVLDLTRRESRLTIVNSLHNAKETYAQRSEALPDGLEKKVLQQFLGRVEAEIKWFSRRSERYDSSLSDLLPGPAARAYADQLHITKLSQFVARPLADISSVLLGPGTQFKEHILYLHPERQKK
jgi:hypothetical protein